MISLEGFLVADDPATWAAAGFTVDEDGSCRIGTVRLRLIGPDAGRGVVGWSLRDLPPGTGAELDGVPTTASTDGPAGPATHANGVTGIDHAVLMSPNLPRTVDALRAIGLEPRRERDGVLGGAPIRQVFFRLGEVILELVGSPDSLGDGPASFWGMTYLVADIDASAAYFGEHGGRVKDAVQPGRRITTLRHRELGMSVRTALISA